MIKKFFKNHPIHKKIVPYLDLFYFLKPINFFIIWVIICIGMYLGLLNLGYSPQFNSNFSYKVLFLFIGLSSISSSFYIREQMNNKPINEQSILSYINERYSKRFVSNLEKLLIYLGIIILIFVNWFNFTIGLLLVLINKLISNNKSSLILNKQYVNITYNLLVSVLLMLSGWFYVNVEYGYKIFDIQFIILLIPYLLLYLSVSFVGPQGLEPRTNGL